VIPALYVLFQALHEKISGAPAATTAAKPQASEGGSGNALPGDAL
jgi:hypothetical protein